MQMRGTDPGPFEDLLRKRAWQAYRRDSDGMSLSRTPAGRSAPRAQLGGTETELQG